MSVEADWRKTIKITLEVTKKKANAFDLTLADTLNVESYYKVFYIKIDEHRCSILSSINVVKTKIKVSH